MASGAIFCANVSTAVTVVDRRSRIKSFIMYNPGASDGEFTLRDGGPTGTTVIKVNVKAGDTVDHFNHDMGVYCSTDIHCSIPTSGGHLTLFYD